MTFQVVVFAPYVERKQFVFSLVPIDVAEEDLAEILGV